jgi:hypothetical protein
MSMGRANIDSPEVLKNFRNHLLKFGKSCDSAIADAKADCARVSEWLRHEQLNHWKRELTKRNEQYQRAKSEYAEARYGSDYTRKNSYVDELKEMRKAEQKKEEAERKLALIKKWSGLLEQKTEKMMGPLNQLAGVLDTALPQSLSRLETMIFSLEDYLRGQATSRDSSS